MEYNERVKQAITTLTVGLAQLEDYLLDRDLEYHDRFTDIEYRLTKNDKTKKRILEALQEDLNEN